MPNVTNEQIAYLVNLQQIEIDSSSIKTKIDTVDSRVQKLDDKLLEFKQTIEEQESLITELNQKYRNYESDVQTNLDRIKKSEAKLSSVKTNKEYQSSLKEIDDLKGKNSKIEDDMIEFLDRIEEAENDQKVKMSEYAALETQLKMEKETIQQEAEKGRNQLAKLEAEWKTISGHIDDNLLAQFHRIKKNQDYKIGIVAVRDGACQGCHMNIPPQMYNELQRGGSLKRCPICERIIFWEDQNRRSE